jgi:tRNA threonylcarbamoyladenosine biosynthesis protein TsaB
MNLLAIDTSTEYASVALIINGEIQSEEQGAQRLHARLLLPMIERLLAEAGLGLGQLDAIVYGRGPGSFTGLRITCSVAKGLAYAQDLPLFPVSSLAAIAYEVFLKPDFLKDAAVLVMLDARMNQLYWGCFPRLHSDCFRSEEVAEQVSAARDVLPNTNNPLILAGVGYESYLQQLSLAVRERIMSQMIIHPKAEVMIRLVLTGQIKAVGVAEALPYYIRNQVTQGGSRG